MPNDVTDFEIATAVIGFGSRKQCRTCKKWKRKQEFSESEYAREGVTAGCRSCVSLLSGSRYRNDAEGRDTRTENRLLRKYGLSLDEYNKMLEA